MRRIWIIPVVVVATVLVYAAVVIHRIEAQAGRDEARAAQAIVIFGAAEYNGRPSPVLRGRLDHALALYHRGLAPVLITTGGAGGDWRFTEAGVERSYLIGHGVPPGDVWSDPSGDSTAASVADVSALLRTHGLGSLLVVSDGYHIYRVKRMFAARGFAVFGSPVPSNDRHGWKYRWLVWRQAVGYMLWRCGFRV